MSYLAISDVTVYSSRDFTEHKRDFSSTCTEAITDLRGWKPLLGGSDSPSESQLRGGATSMPPQRRPCRSWARCPHGSSSALAFVLFCCKDQPPTMFLGASRVTWHGQNPQFQLWLVLTFHRECSQAEVKVSLKGHTGRVTIYLARSKKVQPRKQCRNLEKPIQQF